MGVSCQRRELHLSACPLHCVKRTYKKDTKQGVLSAFPSSAGGVCPLSGGGGADRREGQEEREEASWYIGMLLVSPYLRPFSSREV